MELAEALAGSSAPQWLLDQMALVRIPFVDLGGNHQYGDLVVHHTLAEEVETIFLTIYSIGFPIASILPVVHYDWDDDASMAANNTSAFNYRQIAGQGVLSPHSYGAIDINPAFNPYDNVGASYPPGATYLLERPGTLADSDQCPLGREVIRLFDENGWIWLGRRTHRTDRHHFEKLGYRDCVVRP